MNVLNHHTPNEVWVTLWDHHDICVSPTSTTEPTDKFSQKLVRTLCLRSPPPNLGLHNFLQSVIMWWEYESVNGVGHLWHVFQGPKVMDGNRASKKN